MNGNSLNAYAHTQSSNQIHTPKPLIHTDKVKKINISKKQQKWILRKLTKEPLN